MNYNEWLAMVPRELTKDPLWRIEAYRVGLFAGDIGWRDASKLSADPRTRGLADQLYRALGSVSANLAEGYSRSSGKDRARFYEYALGSARESRGWYFQGRHVLGEPAAEHRIRLLTQVIRLLLVMVPDQRSEALRESPPPYGSSVDTVDLPIQADPVELQALLKTIPQP